MILNLGHQGENNATIFRFPIKDWRVKYGDGEFSFYNKRTSDPDGYLCEVTSDDMYVYWSVSNIDTRYKGKGKCQLIYTVDGVVAKSDTYQTVVEEALSVTTEPPSPWDSWVDDIKNNLKEIKLGDLKIQKLREYLYYIEFTDWDYDKAIEHFKEYYPSQGLCSSVRNGRFYGRNFDWFYDNSASFVVRSKATKGRHASVGIAGGSPLLTNDIVDAGEWNDNYDIIPFITVDGINDAGVACNTNVVPTGDKGHTTGTNPSAENTLCTLMIVRFILDYADSASDAIDKIQNINWYALSGEGAIKAQELHCMVADATSTYVIEFVNNSIKIFSDADDDYPDIPNMMPIMTNFYYDGWDGNIVTGFDVEGGISPDDTTLTSHAEGTERYELIKNRYNSLTSREDMTEMMKDIWYSHAFDPDEDPFWYSELVGYTETFGDLTIYNPASAFEGIKEYVIDLFNHRQRDGKTWWTVHTSIIDMDNKTLTVFPQESDDGFGFTVLQPGERISTLIDAGDITYSSHDVYPLDTVGSEIIDINVDIETAKDAIDDLEDSVEYLLNKDIYAGEVLYDDEEEYYPLSVGKQIHDINRDIIDIASDITGIENQIDDLDERVTDIEETQLTSNDISFSNEVEYGSGTIGHKVQSIESDMHKMYDYTYEVYSISDWEEAEVELEPYYYKAIVSPEYTIGSNTRVELLNDSPAIFVEYGFAINSVSDSGIEILSLSEPEDVVSITICYQG